MRPATIATKSDMKTPWYLRVVNLVIPGVIVAPGTVALLTMLGFTPAWPLEWIILATIGGLAAIAWLGPVIVDAIKQRFWPNNEDHDPRDTAQYQEIQPHDFLPSNSRGFDWTLRLTICVTGFTLLAIMIAFIVLNPAAPLGIIEGTSALQLISFGAEPLAVAALAGAAFGVLVAFVWKPMAQFIASLNKRLTGNRESKDPTKEWERRFYGSKHDMPLYIKLAFGVLAGLAIATFVSHLVAGGLSAPLFAAVTLGVTAITNLYPFVVAFVRNYFTEPREMVKPEHAESRYWFDRSTFDLYFFMNLFLGLAAGLSIGGILASTHPLAMIIAPAVCGGLALIVPAIFSFLKARGFIDRLKARSGFWGPTPHGYSTGALPWTARLFNGASAGAILAGAVMSLNTTPLGWGIAIALVIALPIIALATPMLSAMIREAIPADKAVKDNDGNTVMKPHWLKKWVFSPLPDIDHVERNSQGKPVTKTVHEAKGPQHQAANDTVKLQSNKYLAYGQWYVRLAVGAIAGSLLSLGLKSGLVLGLSFNPIIVMPVATIATAIFFWAVPWCYKRVKFYYDEQKAKRADEAAAAPTQAKSPAGKEPTVTSWARSTRPATDTRMVGNPLSKVSETEEPPRTSSPPTVATVASLNPLATALGRRGVV